MQRRPAGRPAEATSGATVPVLHSGQGVSFPLLESPGAGRRVRIACLPESDRGSLARMARASGVLCALVIWGCSHDPYVIGRYPRDGGEDAGDATDAAADAGSGECTGARAAALVCSDFESDPLANEWPDTSVSTDATLERTTLRAHSGTASLRATSAAADSLAVVARSFPALSSGELWFRAYLYVPSGLLTETMNIFFVGEDPEPNPPEPFLGVDFNLEAGATQLYSPQWTPMRTTGELLIPRDRWFCFRARIAISDTEGAVEVYVDDALAVETTGVDTLPSGGVRRFRAGIDWSSEQDAFFEVFMDDLVLDVEEVGCAM